MVYSRRADRSYRNAADTTSTLKAASRSVDGEAYQVGHMVGPARNTRRRRDERDDVP
jgi:hypothetical protein